MTLQKIKFLKNVTLRKYSFVLFYLFISQQVLSQGQYRVHIKLHVVPEAHKDDSIFVAGNFNEWNPGDSAYRLIKTDAEYSIDITGLKADVYQFKFTRGDWKKAEVNVKGNGIENRLLKLTADTSIEYSIEGWQDDFPEVPKPHTASAHVQILDTAFFMSQLNRSRKVWIYLPEGYAAKKNKQRYPVIYMHDGQNVFDEFTAGYGEWGVDECLDTMIADGKPGCIVVAIDCSAKRMNEYNPYYFEKFGEGEGIKYVEFLVQTLKPFIDKHYRTLPSKQNTIVAGSSMGGLISYYALLSHPKTFGKAGVFSPAFWTAPKIKQLTDSVGADISAKIFFYMGELEGGTYVDDMKEVAENMGKISESTIYTVIDPASRHNEQAWRKWFPEFYIWITADGFNSPIKIEK